MPVVEHSTIHISEAVDYYFQVKMTGRLNRRIYRNQLDPVLLPGTNASIQGMLGYAYRQFGGRAQDPAPEARGFR